jgi:hypothetical protein
VQPRQAAGTEDFAFVFRSKQKGPDPRNSHGNVTAIIKKGKCSDHMSDKQYSHFITLILSAPSPKAVATGVLELSTFFSARRKFCSNGWQRKDFLSGCPMKGSSRLFWCCFCWRGLGYLAAPQPFKKHAKWQKFDFSIN